MPIDEIDLTDGSEIPDKSSVADSAWIVPVLKSDGTDEGGVTVARLGRINAAEQIFSVYVNASTGNDSADGLTISTPVQTIGRAITIVDGYRHGYSSATIVLAAGTYAGGVTLPNNWRSNKRIIIQGPSVTHPTVPTAIINKSVTAADYGIQMTGCFATISNISVVGFAAGTGVIAQDLSDLLTSNVHISGCDIGLKASQSRLRMSGGIIDGNDQNIIAISGATFTIGYAATSLAQGTVISNAAVDGVLVQENSTGHLDYCTVESNEIGLNIVGSSRVHAAASAITGNVTGVKLRMSSHWFDNASTLSGNTTNVIYASGSEEVGSRGDAPTPFRSGYNGTPTNHTGSTSETTLKTFSNILRSNTFTHPGRSLRVIVRGKFNGAGGTKTLRVRLTGGQVSGVVSGGVSQGFFVWESTLNAVDGTTQRYSSMLYDQGSAQYVRGDQGDRSIDVTGAAQSLTVTAQLASASDSVDIREVEVWET